MLYPLDSLPTLMLTANQREEVQCAYLWLQTYSTTEALPPPSPQPTHAELWYMLKYFHQIQILVNTLPSNFQFIVDAHAARYSAAVEGELPGSARCLSFEEVRGWHVPVASVKQARLAD